MHFKKARKGLGGVVCHPHPCPHPLKGSMIAIVMVLACFTTLDAQTITGRIMDSDSMPIAGATVWVKNTTIKTNTSAKGVFVINAKADDVLAITMVGYEPAVLKAGNGYLNIVLQPHAGTLDETVVIAYGSATKRNNTGSVAKLNSTAIATQPISDPLLSLSGRLTGVTVTQSSGVPGSTVKLQVRGRGSIAQGSEPLYIIDGVPLAAQNQPVNRMNSPLSVDASSGMSAFNSLSPSDIESIEVLKDADATAIYGSRGANGVVIITTKKGRQGKTKVGANVYRSYSSATRAMEMLNTQQYLQLRREAFVNDGVSMNTTNAPDVMVWDTTRYSDLRKYFTGGTAKTTDAQISFSGGNVNTQFLVSGNYRKEGTVYPGDMNATRGLTNLQLNHSTNDKRFTLSAGVNTGFSKTNMSSGDLAYFINLPPDHPSFYEVDGTLKWQEGGVQLNNPMGYLLRAYMAKTDNMIARALVNYRILQGLVIRSSFGYNSMRVDESSAQPMASQNPANGLTGSLELSNNHYKGWIAEPQMEYTSNIGKGKLDVLVGMTMQENINEAMNIKGSGYTNDNLIHSIAAAPSITQRRNSYTQYRYAAMFGRVNYNYDRKYIVNISGRRDGSSRFAPERQWAAFGAIGGAWIWSNEQFASSMPWLSFGKLRGSYGTSGNDQIGDYGYLDNWGSGQVYQGSATLYPQNLYSPAYRWEVNKKLEAALELGLWKDKVYVTAAWYRNRSGNQLVSYRMPLQTGFSGITDNLRAVVENKGFELEVSSKNFLSKQFEWSTTFNITIPKNRLVSFPGLATSSYASVYKEGSPLNLIYGYHLTGVNANTGVYEFEDMNKDGALTAVTDYSVNGATDPAFYGGMLNEVRFKSVKASLFVEFKKQTGRNYLYSLYSGGTVPGMMYNMPTAILERWRKAGDDAAVQKLTAVSSSAAYAAGNTLLLSDGIYGDASYVRVKTVSISYDLSKWLGKYKVVQDAILYLRAENLFTITKYKGSDPETQRLYALPPLRTVAVGVNVVL